MPKYVAEMDLFLDGSRIRAGQEFRSPLKPGKHWRLIQADPPAARPAIPAVTRDEAPSAPEGVVEAEGEALSSSAASLPLTPPDLPPTPPIERGVIDEMDDDALRAFIEARTGKAPHHLAKRPKLLADAHFANEGMN